MDVCRLTENNSVYYHCPGCGHAHAVSATRWNWNGSTTAPTLSPSVRHFIPAHEGHFKEETTCHYFIRNGQIEYCADSAHKLAGQTVPLPPLKQDEA